MICLTRSYSKIAKSYTRQPTPPSNLSSAKTAQTSLAKKDTDFLPRPQANAIRQTSALALSNLSLGISAYPDHGSSVERLLQIADAATYAAKAQGRDWVMIGGAREE
jgi:GGDEF domain-containing protein